MSNVITQKRSQEDYHLIPKTPEIDPYEPAEEEEEEWEFLNEVSEKLQARKIQIGTPEQNEKAKRYFDRRDKLVEGIPKSSLHVFDPMDYMEDYNRVIKNNHVLPSQVESLMISLAPLRDKPGGQKIFEALEKKMHSAKLNLSRTMRNI